MKNPKKYLDKYEWLNYLYNTTEKNYNILNIDSLKQINKHSVYNYVLRTLECLNDINKKEHLDKDILYYVEETLRWSDVAKTGSKSTRRKWQKQKYDLFCHNIGSYQIYSDILYVPGIRMDNDDYLWLRPIYSII